MKKRAHRKVVITKVNPRPQWGALRTKNQRLIFGYLVAKTSVKRKGIEARLERQETLSEKEKIWNGIYVSNAELAEFIVASTGIKKNSARTIIQRTLQYLQNVKYIVLHGDQILVNRFTCNRAVEVLWDDRAYCFITPLNSEKSNYSETKINSSETKTDLLRDSSETKTRSSETKTGINVSLQNGTYGQTEPQNDQISGAYINNKYIITESHAENAPCEKGEHFFSPSTDVTTEGKTHDVSRETIAPNTAMLVSSMYNENKEVMQDDLLPAFRVRTKGSGSAFDKPAKLLSYWDTPGVKNYPGLKEVAKQFIEHVKKRYDYDCAFIFEAENYRRLICPELRPDLVLEFGDMPDLLDEDMIVFMPRVVDLKFAVEKIYKECPDMFHRIVTLLRAAPRGILHYRDTGGYWHPPLMHVSMDYNGYMKSSKMTESPFFRDASLTQLRELVHPAKLPDVEVNGKSYPGMYFNLVLQRQIFWLCAVSATSREALDSLLSRFEKDLLENSKTRIYQDYQKKTRSGNLGETNLVNWFKDFCLRYHFFDWWITRVNNDEGRFLLPSLGDNCMISGAVSGIIAYIPTAWGSSREMFFTYAQWSFREKYKKIGETKNIGQDPL